MNKDSFLKPDESSQQPQAKPKPTTAEDQRQSMLRAPIVTVDSVKPTAVDTPSPIDMIIKQPQPKTIATIGKDQLQTNLAKYEELRIKSESQGLTSLVKKAVKRMAFDYMNMLAEEHGPAAKRIPLTLKMNTIAAQLLMNEIQVCYWHALNISRASIWKKKPAIAVERLLINGLFTKINTCDPEHSEVFKTFIQHNYKEVMRTHWSDFAELTDCDQHNWLYFVHPKTADRQGKTLQTDTKIGFEQMKMLFETLFYKVKVDKDSSNHAWNPRNYLFENQLELQKKNYFLVDHPADSYIDYNSMVDNLEEEHMRRDVFTTAFEGGSGTASVNPSGQAANENSVSMISHSHGDETPVSMSKSPNKAQAKARAKLASGQAQAAKKLENAKNEIIKRRGPRKKKDVVQQSDVPAATNSRLMRQTSTSSFSSKKRICSKISFTSTERKRQHKET